MENEAFFNNAFSDKDNFLLNIIHEPPIVFSIKYGFSYDKHVLDSFLSKGEVEKRTDIKLAMQYSHTEIYQSMYVMFCYIHEHQEKPFDLIDWGNIYFSIVHPKIKTEPKRAILQLGEAVYQYYKRPMPPYSPEINRSRQEVSGNISPGSLYCSSSSYTLFPYSPCVSPSPSPIGVAQSPALSGETEETPVIEIDAAL
ncbi:MAG: hypothetical protein K0R12_575 [Gammaproteobacteria bacterium]|nr:hypothetical protein [Gammaproteobacteria bacterium]